MQPLSRRCVRKVTDTYTHGGGGGFHDVGGNTMSNRHLELQAPASRRSRYRGIAGTQIKIAVLPRRASNRAACLLGVGRCGDAPPRQPAGFPATKGPEF